MSGRGIDGGTAAALAARHVNQVVLVDMALSSGMLYLAGCAHDVTWGGNTYRALGGLASIEAIDETASQAKGIALNLAAVTPAAIGGALNEDVRGRLVVVRLGVIDSTGALLVDPNVWRGTLDTMTIDDSADQPMIRVTAEHAMLRWNRPTGVLFSDADQQQIAPGDKFFEFAAAMADQTLAWPDRSFFLQ